MILIYKEFTRVRHTLISVDKMQLSEFHYMPERTEIKGNVSSIRLDSVLSSAFPMSRSKLVGYIEGGKVFVNGKSDYQQWLPSERKPISFLYVVWEEFSMTASQ